MNEVTIAILSAIEAPLPECLAAVETQEGGPYRVVHVKDCFPMSYAFNEMIRQSAPSKYVVQVDGDVVLKPWAVQRLHEAISNAWWCYAAWGQLWEDGFGEGGSVRIWRRWPVRLLGFRDKRSVDRDLHNRMSLFGMRRLEVQGRLTRGSGSGDTEESMRLGNFGVHYPRQTPFARFSKAKNDYLKWDVLGRHDLRLLAINKALQSKDRYAIAGIACSVGAAMDRSKNADLDRVQFDVMQQALEGGE